MRVPAIDWPLISWLGGSPENTGIIIGVILGAYVIALWLTAIIWTARDIRSRSHDPVTGFVAVLMVVALNLPGWVLYRVVRPPLTLAELFDRQLEEETLLRDLGHELACPTCSAPVADDYVACPHCATSLKEPCGGCGKALSFAWRACPWCALERPAAVTAPAAAGAPGVVDGGRGGVTIELEEAPDARPMGEAPGALRQRPRPIEAVEGQAGPWESPGPVQGPRPVDTSTG